MILPYILKTIWCMNIVLWNYGSLWPSVWDYRSVTHIWPQNRLGQCDLYFMVQLFLPYSLKTVWTSLFGIMSRYDPTFNLERIVGHCDLCCMLHWFCVTSWRLFDVLTLYSGIMGHYDPAFNLKINVCHCDLYFIVQWVCDFVHVFWSLFDLGTSYLVIMSHVMWPLT